MECLMKSSLLEKLGSFVFGYKKNSKECYMKYSCKTVAFWSNKIGMCMVPNPNFLRPESYSSAAIWSWSLP